MGPHMSQRAKVKNLEFVGLFARTTLFLESIMPIGKYRGETIEMVIETDPDYMDWFIVNVDQYALDRAAQKELDETPRIGNSDPNEYGFDVDIDCLESPGDLLTAAFCGRRR